MQRIRTTLLLHSSPTGSHHDWLLQNPAGAGLVTFRVGPPTSCWPSHHKLILTRLPDHRPLYLHYQGPLSQHRGYVRRIDSGHAVIHLWRQNRAILNLSTPAFRGLIELRSLAKNRWLAKISPLPRSNPPSRRLS